MIGHVARLASVEERDAVGAADQCCDAANLVRSQRRSDRTARTVAADRCARGVVTVVPGCAMSGLTIVVRGVRGLSPAVVPHAKLRRDRRIAAERQRRYDHKQGQDLENATHEGNPITADFLEDSSDAEEFPFLAYARRSFSACRAA